MEKKRLCLSLGGHRKRKILLVMKLCISLLLCFTLGLSASTLAQQKRVNLDLKQVPIKVLFDEIQKQTNLSFVFNTEQTAKLGEVSVRAIDETVENVLRKVLMNTGMLFEFDGTLIIVRPDEPQKKEVTKINVTGTVKDENGEFLPGVTILLKGSQLGTVTDVDGKFNFELPKQDSLVLVFSFIGYKQQEIKVNSENLQPLSIVLKEEVTEVGEVVVTGYFERRKDSYTGAATTFSGEELKQISTGNVLTTLSTLDPSFKLVENLDMGSNPNYVPEFTIHGGGNLQSDYENSPNMPTFIMDGFEVSSEKVFDMDPHRIASITILKDAAATAIYGSRAANGVVVIETKAPQMGKLRVSYNFSGDFEIADLSDYNLMNAEEKLEYERLAGLYSHSNVQLGDELMDRYNEILALIQSGIDTDWIAKPVKNVGFSHKHSLLVEGGDDKLRYGLTLTYQNKDGVMKGSGRDNLGIDVQLQYRYKTLKFMNDLSFNRVTTSNSPYGDFSEYTYMNPYYYPYADNGNPQKVLYTYENGEEVWNPLYNASLGTKDEQAYDDFLNNFSLEWNVLSGLKLKGNISLNRKTVTSDKFLPGEHTSFQNSSLNGSYTKTIEEYFTYDANVTLSYTRSFGKHQLNGVGVWNVKETRSDMFETVAYNFPNSNMDHIGMGIEYGKGDQPDGNYEVSRLMGFVANFNYGYDNRYLVDASIRSDGSSLFGSDKRWGTFGSIGLAWNLHNESWMKNLGWFDQLKLRGSWGTTGGQNFYPYQAMMMFSYKDELLSSREDSEDENNSQTYDGYIGALLKAFGNTNLKWQKTEKRSIGLDFTLRNSRISGYLNFYKDISKSVLTDVLVAPSLGFTSYKDNLGEVENKGIELNVRATLIQRPANGLRWDVFLNVVKNKNRLMKLNDALAAWNKTQDDEITDEDNKEASRPVVRYQEGESINTIWANESLGIDPVTGDEVFLDLNGRRVDSWSASNYKPMGCEDPKFEGNFGTMLNYKGFQLSAYFKYSYGGDIYNQTLVDKVENVDPLKNADRRVLYDRWQKVGDVAKFKAIDNTTTTYPTSRFIEEQNYITLSSLNLSYEFNPEVLKFLHVERLKLSLIGNDIFRVSTVKMERGITYPYARTFSLSAQLTF